MTSITPITGTPVFQSWSKWGRLSANAEMTIGTTSDLASGCLLVSLLTGDGWKRQTFYMDAIKPVAGPTPGSVIISLVSPPTATSPLRAEAVVTTTEKWEAFAALVLGAQAAAQKEVSDG